MTENFARMTKKTKSFISKKGAHVILRHPHIDDLEDNLSFANKLVAEDTFIMLCELVSREQEEKWLRNTIEQIAQGKKIHYVATVNGTFAGNAEVRIGDKRKKHVGEIGISVAPQFRSEGIGTILMQALIDEAKKKGLRMLYLHCFENNTGAIHLYEKLGFKRAGTVPGMYAYKNDYFGEVTYYLPLT